MRILIAEDEPSLRENLQFMLEMEGYDVQVAQDGRSALDAAVRDPPDLLITDVTMPHIDGHTLVQQLRENARTTLLPIIMLSARSEHKDVRRGMALGADDYLFKPYHREELLEAVVTRLSRQTRQQALQRDLQSMAQAASLQDAVTGLPSRESWEAALQLAMQQHGGTAHRFAILCIGLDHFTQGADTLDKAQAERVLQAVAVRLVALCAPAGIFASMASGPVELCRLGWGQFAMAFQCTQAEGLQALAQAVLDALAKPLALEYSTVFLTACAGAALQDSPGTEATTLLHQAESALAHARPHGLSQLRMFDASDSVHAARSLQIHNGLHEALDQGGLQLAYQPQVCTQTGRLVGFEALLRWRHPTLGWVSPAEFIPVAEQSNLIVKIGEWVLRTAARQAAAWVAEGHTGFCVAVNLSACQLEGNSLPTLVQSALADACLPAHYLELEVTESMAMLNVAQTLSNLHACKALGVKLAMDDFGTGYSSLAYLKRFPLDTLKVDQSFVRNITEDVGDAAITRAVVGLARNLGMEVVAEGVETRAQLDFLRDLGCQVFQGYLFSKPVPAQEAVLCFAGYKPDARFGTAALG